MGYKMKSLYYKIWPAHTIIHDKTLPVTSRIEDTAEDVEGLAYALNNLHDRDLYAFTVDGTRGLTPAHVFRMVTREFHEIDLTEEYKEFVTRVENYLKADEAFREGERNHQQAYYYLVRIAETRIEILGERQVSNIIANLGSYRLAYFDTYPKLEPAAVEATLDAFRKRLFAEVGILNVATTDLETFVLQKNNTRDVKTASARAVLGGGVGRACRLGKKRRLGNG